MKKKVERYRSPRGTVKDKGVNWKKLQTNHLNFRHSFSSGLTLTFVQPGDRAAGDVRGTGEVVRGHQVTFGG